MDTFGYGLHILSEHQRRIVSWWLYLALAALLGAGVYSVLLVLGRTPGVQEWFPVDDAFRIALVVHVTLSVVIWMLSIAAAMWSLTAGAHKPHWDRVSALAASAGAAIVMLSPLLGARDPLMNNYVLLLRHPVFYAGLLLFALGIGSHLARTLMFPKPAVRGLNASSALRGGILLSGGITAIALVSLLGSWAGLPGEMSGEVYFEFLFWGSGHVLQFTYTLLMMVAWVVLLEAGGQRFELTPRLTLTFLVFLALPVIVVPFLYLAHDIDSPGHRLAFTELMKYGGLSCLPIGLAVFVSLLRRDRSNPAPAAEAAYLRTALIASLALFAVGGVLGFLISGLDIVIPAHYHGSTVGVTLAFMGLSYYLLPRLGCGPLPPRTTYWQPIVYGGGQLLHILGLAWTGGYGVQRKTAGLAQGVDRAGEIAGMGLMGLGGLISVIGGLLFVLVCYVSIRNRANKEA